MRTRAKEIGTFQYPQRFVPIETVTRFWEKVNKQSDEECWEWTGYKDKDGYGVIMTSKGEGKIQRLRAHRYSWIIHNKIIPEGFWVLHHCDNPSCVNPKHLFLGTPKDNVQDSIKKGRRGLTGARGENHPQAKLNWKKVHEIRKLFSSGKYTKRDLGRLFFIGDRQIGYIVRYETWRENGKT